AREASKTYKDVGLSGAFVSSAAKAMTIPESSIQTKVSTETTAAVLSYQPTCNSCASQYMAVCRTLCQTPIRSLSQL
ncbi:MAG: hypothetical protein KDE58_16440, partial [Caldilineaceae bacterium]|nr:hypothetical protein [Caldilineaceae bacterium]